MVERLFVGSYTLAPGHMGPVPDERRIANPDADKPLISPLEYRKRLSPAGILDEASTPDADNALNSSETDATQPSPTELIEGSES